MDLNAIKDPSILKDMSATELEVFAQNIREFLINKLSVTGGHLGANLGVVELTIALHKFYDSFNDKFIWDVGHQSYVHKIITGRAKYFDTLRKYKGLSGFPSRFESNHDIWETGHSSTSLSAATGIVLARDMQGLEFEVLPIIGDGALTGGMALEALNHIGDIQKDITIILNDNEMSIGNNVGALHKALRRMASKVNIDDTVVPGIIFEELGITYIGPVDGHDFDALFASFNQAKKQKGPKIIHVLTSKGKGYQPAEDDLKDRWHGVGPYKVDTGEIIKSEDVTITWSEVVSKTLQTLARSNSKLAVITPAMVHGSKLENFQIEFPERIYDVGIAEQHGVTLAGGMAIQGMKPFVAIYSTFLQRAYDQLVHDICRQNLNVAFGIDRAGLVGADGETHQGVFDIAFLRHLPNIVVMMPKDENECQHMVHTAIKYDDGPIALRFPRGEALGIEMDPVLKEIPIGSWEILAKGNDATILTFGKTIDLALEARKALEPLGYSVQVINARFIKPLDEKLLHDLMTINIPILTIEEAVLKGGFGSAVLEFLEEHNYTDQIVKRMGIPDRYIPQGSIKELMNDVGLTKDNVSEMILSMLPNKI